MEIIFIGAKTNLNIRRQNISNLTNDVLQWTATVATNIIDGIFFTFFTSKH